MNELTAILKRWQLDKENHSEAVLATVVHVKGSAYRRPGARMLITDDGFKIGTISGGCLESDVARKAWWWTEEGASIRIFDTTAEDAAWDFGLGCNGEITVLLERIETPSTHKLLQYLSEYQARNEAVVIATLISVTDEYDGNLGDHLLYDEKGFVEGAAPKLADLLTDIVQITFQEKTSRLAYLDKVNVFVEWVNAPQRLVILGAGHDALLLVTTAKIMGWRIIIADHRPAYLKPDRFLGAEQIFCIPSNGDISDLAIKSNDAVVIMTHNYSQDLLLLPQVLAKNPFYIGVLGPRDRTQKMFSDINSNQFLSENIYAPMGLDIGGDTPESIALSIVAEIQSVISERKGGLLRCHKGPIHKPALEVGFVDLKQNISTNHKIVPSCSILDV
ncbi:MAG: hypothetical protein RIR39_899 [Pseudomonadota bacterium]